MTQLKGPLLIFLVVAASFAWGYRSQTPSAVEETAGVQQQPAVSPDADTGAEPVAVAGSPEVQTPEARIPAAGTMAAQPAVDYPQTSVANPALLKPVQPIPPVPAPEQVDPNQNPYRQFMLGANRAASLGDTLDSINPGQRDMKVQRNAYFEKLSQQLNELRGETPPPAQPAAEAQSAQAPSVEPVTRIPPERPAPFAAPINPQTAANAAAAIPPGDLYHEDPGGAVGIDPSGQAFPLPPPGRMGPEIVREDLVEGQIDDGLDPAIDPVGELGAPLGDPAADDALVDEIVDYLAQ